MTSPASAGGRNGLSAVVVARDPVLRSLLLKTLRECRIASSESTVHELARAGVRSDVVCSGPMTAVAVLNLNVPTLIVTRGLAISDQAWADLVRRRPVVISHDDLAPVTLLYGLLRARFGMDLGDVPPRLSWVPPTLLRAFLASPQTIKHIDNCALASGSSRAVLRRAAKGVGCERFEHVVTRLRADVWSWLVSAGVDRRVVEDYLGVTDRSHLRRACRRAGIPVPWNRE